ncbi:ribonuclease H-like domain-containing protein [Paraphysoderma sedebokerense]|nr:ribonuclease H-like domain-containing protein [Paraphysoderma sedebokerense]
MTIPTTPLLKSYTYHSPLPHVTTTKPCMLGVDEAGRGPVLGPMVYGICYCPLESLDTLKEIGVYDSKKLTEEQRDTMFAEIQNKQEELAYSVRVLSPSDISGWMLRKDKYNLNAIAYDATIQLIREVLAKGANIQEIYVDTVGKAEKYEIYLKQTFPSIPKITVTSKADEKFPVVGAASICAKVTRDIVLKTWKFSETGIDENVSTEFGSGYPSDPNTVNWLNSNMDKIFGFPNVIRFSWATCRTLLEKEGVAVTWPEPEEDNGKQITSYFTRSAENNSQETRDKYFESMNMKPVVEF